MVYRVKAQEDSQGYLKVIEFERLSESPEELCDLGSEALFIESSDHTGITWRVNATEASDFKNLEGRQVETYMTFEHLPDGLPDTVDTAFANGELFLSEL